MLERDRLAGGLYGLLIGDALGVPYEFYGAEELPSYDEIEMTPPKGFQKTYPRVEAGTWSDDGAQALCLLDSLLGEGRFSLEKFSDLLLSWYFKLQRRSAGPGVRDGKTGGQRKRGSHAGSPCGSLAQGQKGHGGRCP